MVLEELADLDDFRPKSLHLLLLTHFGPRFALDSLPVPTLRRGYDINP